MTEWFGTMTGWFGTLGEWVRVLGWWILFPFVAKQTQHEESLPYEVPPLTVITTPISTTPAPFEMNVFIDQLLASEQFQQFIAPRLGKFSRDDLMQEILASSQLTNWVTLRLNEKEKVDLDALTAGIWSTGQLQEFINVYLDERKHVLQQELNKQSNYLELHNTKLTGEIERLKEEIERKLNASISEMKERLKEERIRLDELKREQEEEIRLLKGQLEKCCNKTPPVLPLEDIEKYVVQYIAGMYGLANTEKVNYAEIQALMGNMFVGKQQFEAALANVTAYHKAEMREVSEQSAQTIMDTISERITDEFASHQKLNLAAASTSSFHRSNSESSTTFVGGSGGLTDGQVLEIVNRAIMTYDADKTGMVDYALESSGGSVISTRCTESYYKHSASMTLFGIPYWYPVNTPRTVIQPGVHPGECWAFRGSQGFLVIQLAGKVRISSFSLEHIPRSLAFSGNIDSAPKDFSVWGLETENDVEPTELGKYTYLKNSTSLQYFLVKRSDIQPFKIIELRIDSNHGNLEYTCLYRFRVHGTWVSY